MGNLQFKVAHPRSSIKVYLNIPAMLSHLFGKPHEKCNLGVYI